MALRLRRGTDAERQLITPLEGELIYTTDTKLLWIGDGGTVGGNLVTGGAGTPFALADATDVDTTGVQDQQVLQYNALSGNWEPGITQQVTSELDDLTNVVAANPNLNDVLSWDGLNWTATASNVTLDSLTDVVSGPAVLGDFLVYDGANWIPQSSAEVGLTNLTADIKGSVFADDSTLLVDGINGTLSNGSLVFENNTISAVIDDNITIKTEILAQQFYGVENTTDGTLYTLEAFRGTETSPAVVQAGDPVGTLAFAGYDGTSTVTQGAINVSIDTVTGTNQLPGKMSVYLHDYDGNYFIAIGADSRGTVTVPTLKVTPYADAAARDAAIPSPEAGMMVYITSTNKHQGYDGTTWNDFY